MGRGRIMAIKIKMVPFKNNLLTYKDVPNIIGVFPVPITPGMTYELQLHNNMARLHVKQTGAVFSYSIFNPLYTPPQPNIMYLAWDGKRYTGIVINPAISKMSTVTLLTPVYLNTQMANNVFSHLTKKQKFQSLELLITQLSEQLPKEAPAALYRLRLIALSGTAPPEPQGDLRKWVISYSNAPESTMKKLSAVMRMYAWQAEIHMPKEDINTKIHYGFFPLAGTSRQINKEQYAYLTRIYAPE